MQLFLALVHSAQSLLMTEKTVGKPQSVSDLGTLRYSEPIISQEVLISSPMLPFDSTLSGLIAREGRDGPRAAAGLVTQGKIHAQPGRQASALF
jgi:hypothetical protein